MNPSNTNPAREHRWPLLLTGVAVLACIVLLFELGDSKTLTSHEVFTAVPVREMLQSGDWIVPRYGGVPRVEKPPLVYWVTATSAFVFGQVSECSVRIPSAVSALLLAALVGIWAGRWYSREVGLAAGLIQATSVWSIIYGRKAEFDMPLCLMITAALFLLAEQREDEGKRVSFLRWMGIYTLLSLTWLGKFHFGVVMVLGPGVVYLCLQRRFRELRGLWNPVGLLILSAAITVWPYLVLQRVPNTMSVWLGETIGRATGGLGHEPIWFYFPHMLCFLLPWLPLVVYALPGSLRKAFYQGDSRERFLWTWFFVQLVIVCASANKHRNYILPLLPVCSLLAAQAASELSRRVWQGAGRMRFRTAVIVTVSSIGGMIPVWVALTDKWPHLMVSLTVLVVSASGATCLTTWLFERRHLRAAGLSAMSGFLAGYVCITGWILPGRDHRAAAAQFGKAIRDELATGQEVCVYRMVKAHGGKHPIVYYLNDPVSRVESRELLQKRLARDKRVFVVTYEPTVGELTDLGHLQELKKMTTPRGRAPFRGPPLVLVGLSSAELAGQDRVQQIMLRTGHTESESMHR